MRWWTVLAAAAAVLVVGVAACDGDGGGAVDGAGGDGGAQSDARADAGATTDAAAADVQGGGGPDATFETAGADAASDTVIEDAVADAGVVATDAVEGVDVPPQSGPLALAPGQAAELVLDGGAATVALATPGGDEAFLLVLASTVLDGTQGTFEYTLASGGDDEAGPYDVLHGCTLSSAAWRDAALPGEEAPSGEPPAVGDRRTFSMLEGFGAAEVPAEVVAVGANAVVWADVTEERPAVLEPDFVEEFLGDFDELILPRAREVFGVETDLDGDGRIALLFSPRTYDHAVAFFSGCDLLQMNGCPTGNAGEVLYVTPPNVIAPPYDTPNAMKEILAHELQHLVHFGRQVIGNDLASWAENAYLLEGVAALAQDVLGYQAGNFYVTKAGLDLLADFSAGEILAPWGQYRADRDGALRGGAYLFARWLYDSAGGDEATIDGSIANRGGPAFVRALGESPDPIAAFLPEVTGAPLEDVVMDFFTTLALSNRNVVGDAAPENPCFRYRPTALDPVTGRQRGADLFASFHGQRMNGPAVQAATDADGVLRKGGVDLLQVDAEPGAPVTTWNLTVDPAAAPRLRVVRIR